MTSFTSQSGSSRSGHRTTDGADRAFRFGLALALLLAVVALWPALGAGFQTDDFRWLWHARIHSGADVVRLFTETIGFYRPVTALTWSVDIARAGQDPTPFAMTNFGLHLLALLLFAGLARRLSPTPAAAAAAMVLAALGHPYTNMAVLWLSGRGALLAAAAAMAALWLWDRWCAGEAGHAAYGGALLMLGFALGSYEAVAGLPVLMALLLYRRRRWVWIAGPVVVWSAYMAARLAAGARQPWAPGGGYEYTVAAVIPNLAEYVARVAIAGVVIGGLLLAAAAAAGAFRDVWSAVGRAVSDTAPLGASWVLLGLLPALPVASRSNLYVYFAAFGAQLVLGAGLAAGFMALAARRRRAAAALAAGLLVVLSVGWPFFAWDRNHRHVAPAELAMRSVAAMRGLVATPAIGECLVLIDNGDLSPNLDTAFSEHLPWVGAFVYRTAPSERIVYQSDLEAARRAGCRDPVNLELADSGQGAVGLRLQAPEAR